MNTLSDEQLKELEGLYQKATQGEWSFDGRELVSYSPERQTYTICVTCIPVDSEFMANLRNAFPALLYTIQSLRAKLDEAMERGAKWDMHERKKCEYCGSSEHLHAASMPCPGCGAPQCCTICCKMENFKRERDSLRTELATAKEREQGCYQAVRKHLSDFADSEYVRGCNLLRRTECLGWEAKAKTGKFGEAEMNAHKAANMAFGAYEGIHAALRHLPALSKPPTKGEEES